MKKFWKNFIQKPFKGNAAYELQIGRFVFLLRYPHSNMFPNREHWKFDCFTDPDWNRR